MKGMTLAFKLAFFNSFGFQANGFAFIYFFPADFARIFTFLVSFLYLLYFSAKIKVFKFNRSNLKQTILSLSLLRLQNKSNPNVK